MKILTTGAALLATFVTQTASAKTLEDVLQEKGVITEQDRAEVAKDQVKTQVKAKDQAKPKAKDPSAYKVGKGFTFNSEDEKFQLYIGGRIQARYTFLNRKDGAQNMSKWEVRRVKLWLGGHAYTEKLTYYLQTELSNSDAAKIIDWAYLNYEFIPELQVLAGQSKVPFGRQWLTSAGSLEFVERSPVSDFFRPGYDLGVKVHGQIAKGFVNYDVGTYGGKGKGVPSTNNRNSFAARIAIEPLGSMTPGEGDLGPSTRPLVSVGANYFYDRLQNKLDKATNTVAVEKNNLNIGFLSSATVANHFSPNEKLDINLGGIDAAVKWMGFFGTGEIFFGKVAGDTSNAQVHSRGYLAQGGYCIIPKTLEVAARYSYIDPNRSKKLDLRHEIAGAISYYIAKHNLKLQGDIANLYDRASTGDRNDMQYRVQAQMDF